MVEVDSLSRATHLMESEGAWSPCDMFGQDLNCLSGEISFAFSLFKSVKPLEGLGNIFHMFSISKWWQTEVNGVLRETLKASQWSSGIQCDLEASDSPPLL